MSTDTATITIHHSGDGTTVEGTERGDTATIGVLKSAGFRWSRNLGAWFLPRTWSEPTRAQRVQEVTRKLQSVTVERGSLARSGDADQWAADRVAHAEDRADRNAAYAERKAAEADTLHDRSRAITDGIPFGQPILVGHHSERGHRNALDKSWSLLGKSLEADREASDAARRAESQRHAAETYDNPVTITRRIERNATELRKLERVLSGRPIWVDTVAQSEWRERVTVMRDELAAKIDRDKRTLEASGVVIHSRDTVKVGDTVRIRGTVYTVLKTSPKTVSVMTTVGVLKYPYGEITDHRAA